MIIKYKLHLIIPTNINDSTLQNGIDMVFSIYAATAAYWQ